MAHSLYGPAMQTLYGNDVKDLLIEQLQSDEESTDEGSAKFSVVRPSWRSEEVRKRYFFKLALN